MASVHFPGQETRRLSHLRSLADVPFILTDDEDHPGAINDYLRQRSLGTLAHGGPSSKIVGKVLEIATRKSLARTIADFLTWLETEGAHPKLGKIPWAGAKLWHIQELYKEDLVKGRWTEAFFINGEPRSLSTDSLRTRISQVLDCYRHLERGGHITSFDYSPSIKLLTMAKDDAQHSYRLQSRQLRVLQNSGLPKRVRRSPASTNLPSIEHLTDFFREFRNTAHRIAAMIMFETGQRVEEVVENTLLPGMIHRRDLDGQSGWYQGLRWPQTTYRLEYRPDDDRMIGVLPSRSAAFGPRAGQGHQCAYKVLGKGRTIRLVNMPPRLAGYIWRYVDSDERRELAARGLARTGIEPANLLLNRFGDKLSAHAIWEAFEAVNERLAGNLRITPHELRHAYACYFLEQYILNEARKQGIREDSIPRDFVLNVGHTALLTVQREMGHTEFSTTRRYLDQLANGRVHLSALKSWNAFLDGMTPHV